MAGKVSVFQFCVGGKYNSKGEQMQVFDLVQKRCSGHLGQVLVAQAWAKVVTADHFGIN